MIHPIAHESRPRYASGSVRDRRSARGGWHGRGVSGPRYEARSRRRDQSAAGIAATDPGAVTGTVGYMAPEQIRGQQVDARADLLR